MQYRNTPWNSAFYARFRFTTNHAARRLFMIITFLVVALAYLPRAHAAEPPPKTAIQQNTTQQAPNLANPATSTATQGPAATQNQTIKIAGTSYATGVRLGLPIAVLIRAKALSEKANQQTLKTAGN